MNHTLAFGHKNPDTDSICSSIAYANLKNILGEPTVPYRLGEITKETKFVLNYFNVSTPEFLKTVSPQISDLTKVEKTVIHYKSSLKEALDIMSKENFSSLPVVDSKNRLKGMLHISDIANTYLNLDHEELFAKYTSTYLNLKEILNGEVVSGDYPTGEIKSNLKAVSQLDTAKPGDIVVTTYMADGIDKSIEAGARVVIVCCEEDVHIVPRNTNTSCILKVRLSLFKTLRLITQSISISNLTRNNGFYSFKTDDYLYEIRDIMKESQQTNFPVTSKNGEVYGTIRTKNLINFTRKKVILLDHNERTQSVDGIQDSKISEVVDHHKFANFETNEPVRITAESVGCTCTIIYNIYKENGIIPDKVIAGLLLSAILSDTLIFKSPTCTETDKFAAIELGKIAEIDDINKYGMEMLIAGTSLDDLSSHDILHSDMKEFVMGSYTLAVAQINTVDIQGVLRRKEELLSSLSKELNENKYDLSILVITDIINSGSMVLVAGKHFSIIEKAFNVEVKENLAWLDGVVSRKKQIVPFLMASVQSLED